jgi:hypothetical protein
MVMTIRKTRQALTKRDIPPHFIPPAANAPFIPPLAATPVTSPLPALPL